MKIVNKTIESTKFRQLNNGDVFQVANDPKFYMKTETVMTFEGEDLNTVCLNTARLYSLGDNLDTFPVDCELIIK